MTIEEINGRDQAVPGAKVWQARLDKFKADAEAKTAELKQSGNMR